MQAVFLDFFIFLQQFIQIFFSNKKEYLQIGVIYPQYSFSIYYYRKKEQTF